MFTREDLKELETMHRAAVEALPQVQYTRGYPTYPDAVNAFMDKLGSPPWNNRSYNPREIVGLIENIANAKEIDLRSILTSVHRAERFGDGNWIAMLESGEIDKVIERAWQLLETA